MAEIEGTVLLVVIGLAFAAIVYLGVRLSSKKNPLLSSLGIMMIVVGLILIIIMLLWMMMWD